MNIWGNIHINVVYVIFCRINFVSLLLYIIVITAIQSSVTEIFVSLSRLEILYSKVYFIHHVYDGCC